MNLEQLINDDIKAAMLAKDKPTLEALRAVKAAILLAKTDKGTSGEGMEEGVEMKILHKLVKQRRDSAEIFKQQARSDLAEDELFQLSVIEKYLPAQMTEEEITKIISAVITQSGATSIKDMGKVMGTATKQLAGKADNKVVSDLVKKLLNG